MAKKKNNSTQDENEVSCSCYHCGIELEQDRFHTSNSTFFEGLGYLPVCKDCLQRIFSHYIIKYGDTKRAIQRVCMAFDLYYDERIFKSTDTGQPDMLGAYIKQCNMVQYRGKTFDTSLEKGFLFADEKTAEAVETAIEESPIIDEPDNDIGIDSKDDSGGKVKQVDIKRWGDDFDPIDYTTLNSQYKLLKQANPKCDSNQENGIIDLCYIQMLKMKALREGNISDFNKLSENYRKTFSQLGLKVGEEEEKNENDTWGTLVQQVEQYVPAEIYVNQKLYKDIDDLDYYGRFVGRPRDNILQKTTERDPEYYVHEEDGDIDVD